MISTCLLKRNEHQLKNKNKKITEDGLFKGSHV